MQSVERFMGGNVEIFEEFFKICVFVNYDRFTHFFGGGIVVVVGGIVVVGGFGGFGFIFFVFFFGVE